MSDAVRCLARAASAPHHPVAEPAATPASLAQRVDPLPVGAVDPLPVGAIAPAPDTPPDRESLRLLLIGSRQGVLTTIQTLYRLGFAEVGEWSPLLPAPTPGEVMSILTRYRLADPR